MADFLINFHPFETLDFTRLRINRSYLISIGKVDKHPGALVIHKPVLWQMMLKDNTAIRSDLKHPRTIKLTLQIKDLLLSLMNRSINEFFSQAQVPRCGTITATGEKLFVAGSNLNQEPPRLVKNQNQNLTMPCSIKMAQIAWTDVSRINATLINQTQILNPMGIFILLKSTHLFKCFILP